MDPRHALRLLWWWSVSLIRWLAWVLATAWLGLHAVGRLGVLLGHLPELFAETLQCPRGHEVPTYGVYECATCRSYHEGWAFGRCSVCGNSAGWTPCPECGLPVLNPLRR